MLVWIQGYEDSPQHSTALITALAKSDMMLIGICLDLHGSVQ